MDQENEVVIDEQLLQAAAEVVKVLANAIEEVMPAIAEMWYELYEALEKVCESVDWQHLAEQLEQLERLAIEVNQEEEKQRWQQKLNHKQHHKEISQMKLNKCYGQNIIKNTRYYRRGSM